jgi:hypothetical protein
LGTRHAHARIGKRNLIPQPTVEEEIPCRGWRFHTLVSPRMRRWRDCTALLSLDQGSDRGACLPMPRCSLSLSLMISCSAHRLLAGWVVHGLGCWCWDLLWASHVDGGFDFPRRRAEYDDTARAFLRTRSYAPATVFVSSTWLRSEEKFFLPMVRGPTGETFSGRSDIL